MSCFPGHLLYKVCISTPISYSTSRFNVDATDRRQAPPPRGFGTTAGGHQECPAAPSNLQTNQCFRGKPTRRQEEQKKGQLDSARSWARVRIPTGPNARGATCQYFEEPELGNVSRCGSIYNSLYTSSSEMNASTREIVCHPSELLE